MAFNRSKSGGQESVGPPRHDADSLRVMTWFHQHENLVHWFIPGAVLIVLIVLINPSGEFPLNDEWIYALAVQSILETGQYRIPGPITADVFTQI